LMGFFSLDRRRPARAPPGRTPHHHRPLMGPPTTRLPIRPTSGLNSLRESWR
jgi:hypothetical protein